MNTAAKGRTGEAEAVRYLEAQGYTVIARNFRAGRGEIDIIAQNDSVVAVIEVKSWSAFGAEQLEFSIGANKRRSIIQGARMFLRTHPEYAESRIRFDVLFHQPKTGEVRHIENAFTEMSDRW